MTNQTQDSPAVEPWLKRPLVWYSHRYGRRPENLARAKERFAELAPKFATKGQVLIAPWFALADAGVDETRARAFCRAGVAASDELFLDLDGEEQSVGMLEEHETADAHGVSVSWLRTRP